MRILFQLVSGQVIPNITANDFFKPDKVYYFYTAQTKKELDLIISIVNVPHENIEILGFDYENVYSKMSSVINQISNPDNEICLNFTNGTKIMSIAAYNLFTEKQFDRIYINTEKNEVLIFKNNLPVQSRNIESLIDIEDYFALHGHKIKSYSKSNEILINENYEKLYKFLVLHFNKFGDKVLDFARQFNEKKFLNYSKSGIKIESINKKINITLEYQGDKLSITNENPEILKFINGDWFEYYCYKELDKINIFDRLYLNVKVAWKGKKSENLDKNQIDILGIKGTTPYIFECKSGRIKQEAIGQLAAIKNEYFDRYTKSILISYFRQDDLILEKAKGYNDIYHILSQNIANSKNQIIKADPKLR
ncbi:MAG: DUF1887 family CARF protein [Melioribacteraceae bacterium]|nr:DUF1887 family CARF protein [Melioribacteraceae bacterium]